MADINVERKGPSIWPWVIGLLVLALLIWAIAEMVDTDEQVQEVAEVETVEEPPAAMPEPGMEEEAAGIETLLPLGPEDEGMRAEISGTVVGEPLQDGFWIRAGDNTVLFVRSDRSVQSGDNVDGLTGTVVTAPEERITNWTDTARLSEAAEFDQWDVQGEFYLDATAGQAAPGAQQQQQGQQGQQAPGAQQRSDTVEGRY